MSELTWKDESRFVLGGTTFQALPADVFAEDSHLELRNGEFLVFKARPLVERYVALIDELEPQHIFELGFFQGGSTLFFAELARPRRLVSIDRRPLTEARKRVESHAADRGLSGVVRTYGEVDQADRQSLADLVDEAFRHAALDLVIDDCSHLYEPTRGSFNELFPRLRPGGAYVIEDWWPHTPVDGGPSNGRFGDHMPLARLVFEIVLAIQGMPDLIAEVSIDTELALIRRGEAEIEPTSFDVSASSTPTGQALLAPA
jgi:SAM-dependent methyltransferase